MGLDRLVMTLKDIPDVRYIRSNNPKISDQMNDLEPYKEVSNQPAITRDMSYSVPAYYVEEDISQAIMGAMGEYIDALEEVEILTETIYGNLPPKVRSKLGIKKGQKNVLVRVTLRHLEKSLTKAEANQIYNIVYAKINHGDSGYL